MILRGRLASLLYGLADRLLARAEQTGEAKTFQPGPELLRSVRVGFVLQSTSFSAWCGDNGINRRNAAYALLGGWRGPKGRAVARRVAKAAGVGEIKWNQ